MTHGSPSSGSGARPTAREGATLSASTRSNAAVHVRLPSLWLTTAITGGIVVVGVLVDLVAYASDRGDDSYWRQFFSLDGELNLPTWWSVLLLAVAAWLAYTTPDDVASDHTALHRHKWRLLGLILLAMSLDEAATVHETVGEWLQQRVETGGLLTYAWVIPAAIAVVAVALLYLRFVLDLPKAVRTRVILAAVTYVAGSLIVEMIDGDVNGRTSGTSSASKIFFTSVQEAMELAGTLLALSALLLIRRENGASHPSNSDHTPVD